MAWDVGLWGLLAACVVYGDRLAADVSDAPAPWWLTAAGTAALALAVGLARRWPLAGWLVTAALGLAASPGLFTVSYGPALAALSCVLGSRAEEARPALLAFAGTAGAGVAGVLLRTEDDAAPPDDPLLGCLVMLAALVFGAVFPWVVGRYRRQHRALVAAGWERAERLEREQRAAAERARLRERARIAQDMHDALGHELSLIALRAGALQVAPGLSAEHSASAARLRGAAAEATDRLHEIIGVLRDPTEEYGEADREEYGDGAGPRADGGFRVEARIPADAAGADAAGHGRRPARADAPPTVPVLVPVRAAHAPRPEERRWGHGQSAAAHQYARQRRAVRRAVALSVSGAGAVAAVVVAAVLAWYAYTATHSVLEPAAYERLRLGATETDVRAVLPAREVTDAPTERGPARPQGARCAYYRVSGALFVGVDDYRLCFRDGRLVDKALIRDALNRALDAPATSPGSVPK
ncbi:histidine kinase [Streptomyces daliensis]